MTLYSSGAHAKLTADKCPETQDGAHDWRIFASSGYAYCQFCEAEFDRPLTNPANPILVRMRVLRSEPDAIQAASSWIVAIDRGYYNEYPKRAREHARKVLTRLERMRLA